MSKETARLKEISKRYLQGKALPDDANDLSHLAEHFEKLEERFSIANKAINEAVRRNCLTSMNTDTHEHYDVLDHLKKAKNALRRAARKQKK